MAVPMGVTSASEADVVIKGSIITHNNNMELLHNKNSMV